MGHFTGCILPGDVYSRFLKLKGEDAIYVCGTDEYGTPTEVAAQKEGVTPQELTDKYYAKQNEVLKKFNVQFDIYSRTTTLDHTKQVHEFYNAWKHNNFIYRKEIEQLYCKHCDRFLPDRYVEGICPLCGAEGARGDQCDTCGKPLDPTDLKNPYCITCKNTPELRKTEHVFFELSKLEEQVLEWVENHEGLFQNSKNFALGFIKQGLNDKDMSRDLKWGVPIPDAPGQVFYVWFDAPIGYVTFTKQLGKLNWWQDKNTRLVHFIGKDNIPFHTIYFPAMLIARGDDYILPYKVASYEYLTFKGSKLSKSKGHMITLREAAELFPVDYWRYFIISSLPERADTDFTWEGFQERINNELNNDVGNLVQRALSLAKKYVNSTVPKPVTLTDNDKIVLKQIETSAQQVAELIYDIKLKEALQEVAKLARIGNQYIQIEEPWKNQERQKEIIFVSLNVVKALSILLEPFIPETAKKIQDYLNLKPQMYDNIADHLEPGHELNKEFEPLIKKIEDKDLPIKNEGQQQQGVKEKPGDANAKVKSAAVSTEVGKAAVAAVEYDDFAKLKFKVGTIKSAERIEGADKLFKLTVDVGEQNPRTLAAGIAEFYKPEELVGKQVIVLANLKPRTIRGIESQGMLLASETEDGKRVKFVTVHEEMPPGSKIR